MSAKLICLLVISALCAIILIAAAGSRGFAFYGRSRKKQTSIGNIVSRKFFRTSPVHTSYRNSRRHRSVHHNSASSQNSSISHKSPTHHLPNVSEISLPPLISTPFPNGLPFSDSIFEDIFKHLPNFNATFELPTATAPPPASPPINGTISMPLSFNETDPKKADTVAVVKKTTFFPATPASPAPPAPPTTSMAPTAGDISVDVATTIKAALA